MKYTLEIFHPFIHPNISKKGGHWHLQDIYHEQHLWNLCNPRLTYKNHQGKMICLLLVIKINGRKYNTIEILKYLYYAYF